MYQYKINIFKYTRFKPQIIKNHNSNYLFTFRNSVRDWYTFCYISNEEKIYSFKSN